MSQQIKDALKGRYLRPLSLKNWINAASPASPLLPPLHKIKTPYELGCFG
ncbi:hypothetical protein [Nostoc sp.]